jgi:hypothetical protein
MRLKAVSIHPPLQPVLEYVQSTNICSERRVSSPRLINLAASIAATVAKAQQEPQEP